MKEQAFYCSHCKRIFGGEFSKTERPQCPQCNRRTLFSGYTKEEWIKMGKEDRNKVIEELSAQRQRQENRETYADSVGVDYTEASEEKESFIDRLYKDIGQRIKMLAVGIFILEALASVFVAMACFLNGGDSNMIAGLLCLLLGPVIAYVSSLLLYAFGELVDKTVENERNTANILKLMLEKEANNEK